MREYDDVDGDYSDSDYKPPTKAALDYSDERRRIGHDLSKLGAEMV